MFLASDSIILDGEEFKGHELLQMMQQLFKIEGYYEFQNGNLGLVVLNDFDRGHGMPVRAMLQWAEGGVLLPEEGEKYLKEWEAERIRRASGDEPITLKDFLNK